jgi:hypothetical protein
MLGKLHSYLSKVGVFLIPVALVVGMAGCTGDDGSYPGPRGHPPFQNSPPQNLEIRTWYDLDTVRNNFAGNHTLMNDLDFTTPGYWELASPISNQGEGWEPIGFVQVIYWDSPFGGGGSREDWYGLNGTFDGQGYEIRDLFTDRPIDNDVGLFGVVDEGGVIKDIGVVNVTVIGDYYVGGLVGRNRGTVSNSYSSGNVAWGEWGGGGLVGVNHGTVSNSYSICDLIGNSAIGGLVGGNEGTVTNSYSAGRVSGVTDVGGLIGRHTGSVSYSFWNIQTSGQTKSSGGTGKTTAEMHDIAIFAAAGWDICAVAPGELNTTCIWNIVDGVTYPFLSWQS